LAPGRSTVHIPTHDGRGPSRKPQRERMLRKNSLPEVSFTGLLGRRSMSRISMATTHKTADPACVGVDNDCADIYEAVVRAAFNCLHIRRRRVPAIIPFLGCSVLATIQLFLLSGVALEVKQEKYFVFQQERLKSSRGNFDMCSLSVIGLLIVVQVMIFTELFAAITNGVYVLTTDHWTNPPRPSQRGWHVFNAVLALLACSMKVGIAYLTAEVSMSIVLSIDNLTERIFNSLALTFILDLDDKLWVVAQQAVAGLRASKCDGFCQVIGTRRISVFTILAMCYEHQATNMLFALMSGWLPTTRFICVTRAVVPFIFQMGQGWGAQALSTKIDICSKHGYSFTGLSMYGKVIQHYPQTWSSLAFLLILGLVLVAANDQCRLCDFIFPDDEAEYEASPEAAEDEDSDHEEEKRRPGEKGWMP